LDGSGADLLLAIASLESTNEQAFDTLVGLDTGNSVFNVVLNNHNMSPIKLQQLLTIFISYLKYIIIINLKQLYN